MRKVKILFFAADPASAPGVSPTQRLLLDEDVRSIREMLRRADYRDAFELDLRLAARPDDLLQGLNEIRPHVVHFSGHGGRDGVEMVGNDGQPHIVGTEALVRLFRAFPDVRLVLLNACHSLPHAQAIAQAVGCAVGNSRRVPDKAAILFGASFYRAVAFGHSVQAAYDQACVSLSVNHYFEPEFPELVTGPGVDASRLVLVAPDETEDGGGRDARGPREPGGSGPGARQSVNVTGNGNVVNVAGRNVHTSNPPPARPPPADSFVTITVPVARHGVPACKSPNAVKLFGRGAEVGRFVSLLTDVDDAARAHAVHGLPGAGKTDLLRAVGCAPRVVEAFPGGVLYAELGQAADAVEVLRGWCIGLGLEPPASGVADDFAGLVRGHLATRPALLVLDDVWETSVAAAHALADCRAPGCGLLLSTRSPGIAGAFAGSPERTYRMPMLADEPAVELLREHAPHAVRADPGGAAELAASLGNLPLALKLAGHLAQADDSPRPCAHLLDSWRLRLKEMKGYERRPNLASGEISLDAIISMSYDAMPNDDTRAAAASLSVLGAAPYDFNRRAIEVAWSVIGMAPGSAPLRVDEWIRAFVASGLLERNPATQRYSLHQTVHAFLEERCRAWKMPSA